MHSMNRFSYVVHPPHTDFILPITRQREQWTVSLNAIVSKVTMLGEPWVSFGGGVRYRADGPDSGPHRWAFRLSVTLLFPR